MNSYSLATYTTSASTLLIGAFVFIKNSRRRTHQIFCAYSLAISFWAFLSASHMILSSPSWSLFCARWMHLTVPLIPVLFVHFLWVFLELSDQPKLQGIIVAGYVGALALAFVTIGSSVFVAGVRPQLGYAHLMDPGPLYFLLMFFFMAYSLVGLYLLLRAMSTATGLCRNQVRVLFWGSLIGYAFGASNFFSVYDLILFPYPYGSYGITVYVFLVAYAIVRHRFLEIEVIIRRTIVFAGLLAFVFGVFAAATFLVQELLTVHLGKGKFWASAASVFFIVLGYDPIRNILSRLTDRYLFQKRYDAEKLLRDASRGMARIENLRHLLGLVVHYVTMRVRINRAAAILYDDSSGNYRIVCSRGFHDGMGRLKDIEMGAPQRASSSHSASYVSGRGILTGRVISRDHSLVSYLSGEHEALDRERLKAYLASGGRVRGRGKRGEKRYDFTAIQEVMNDLGASCVIPSFLGTDLRSILVLGEKKSGHAYTEQDLSVLYTLAQEAAIAIENARLYDEAVRKSQELERINFQLADASRKLGLALAQAEEANKRLLDAQAQLIHENKMGTLGRLAASVGHEVNNPLTVLSMNVSRMILKYRKDPNLKVAEIADFFEKMESNIQRIKAVVNTLTGLLKKSEKGKFEPLSLKLVIEETLPLVQFQTYLDNLAGTEVEFEIPGDLPLIKGDLERLQEVFLNLFTNAYHALADRKERRIRIIGRLTPSNPGFVEVQFEDSGCGMDAETVNRIFSYGFTTKRDGKGSGIGLYICRYIIELHGGIIRVHSRKGEGTTFSLTLPVYEDHRERLLR